MLLVVEAAGQPGAEGCADRQARRGGEVVAHRDAEPAGQGPPQPPPQLDAVPHHRARHGHRSGDGQRPPAGRHADEHGADTGDEQGDPPVLGGAVVDGLGGLEQGLGEVGAPHHRRVGEGTEQHEVHEEPGRAGHERVHQGQGRGQPEPDEAGAVAQRPGTAVRCGRGRHRNGGRCGAGEGCGRGGAGHGVLRRRRIRTARAAGWCPRGRPRWARPAARAVGGRDRGPRRAAGAAGPPPCRSRRLP